MDSSSPGNGPPTEANATAFENYAFAVEDYFLRRRGSARLVSPRDWALIRGWFEQEIPLEVALAGMAEVFDRHAATGRVDPVSSIGYCRHAVAKRWKEHCEATLGGEADAGRRRRRSPANDFTRSLAARFRGRGRATGGQHTGGGDGHRGSGAGNSSTRDPDCDADLRS